MDTYLLPSHQYEKVHGNRLQPYAIYHSQVSGNKILLHWHEEAEIAVIREGTAYYQIDQEIITVKEGDLIFIAPNTLHSIFSKAGKTMISDSLVFHLDLIGQSLLDQCALSYLQPIYDGTLKCPPCIREGHLVYDELFSCMDICMNSICQEVPFYELKLREQLNRCLFLLYSSHSFKSTTNSKNTLLQTEKLKSALLYIHENYKEPISISYLAKLCNFSNSHYMSFFKSVVGISCIEYIIQLRLKVAVDLLKTTDDSIAEIAYECGFNNLSNFNRKFKSYYNTTPRKYKTEYKTSI